MGDRRSTACWWYSKVAKQLEYYHELQAVDRRTKIPDRGLLKGTMFQMKNTFTSHKQIYL